MLFIEPHSRVTLLVTAETIRGICRRYISEARPFISESSIQITHVHDIPELICPEDFTVKTSSL